MCNKNIIKNGIVQNNQNGITTIIIDLKVTSETRRNTRSYNLSNFKFAYLRSSAQDTGELFF